MASISSKGETDMISGLPEEVLSHIFSLLPLEDAIKSTLLLKRFRNLWRSFPRLILDTFKTWRINGGPRNPPVNNEKFANLIHHVLIFHERMSIDELCLRHHFFFKYSKDPDYSTNPGPELAIRIIEEMRFAGIIDSLVSFAIIKRCKVLTLDFLTTEKRKLQQGYMLPTVVYRSIYLTKLSLCACHITSCDVVLLKSLKLLHFRAVVMSDNAMEKILFGCPSLEELSLFCCCGLHNLSFNNNIKLKRLTIYHWNDELLTVSNLNVVCLNIDMTWIESVLILKATVVDATVCCFMLFKYERRSYEGFKFLLQSLDHCKTFRPNQWSVVVLGIWELTNTPCPYFEWKHIALELHLTNCVVQIGLSMLLRHVPLLETLIIHVQPKPEFEFMDEENQWLVEYELDEDKYWNEQEASFENLKMVVIHGGLIAEPATILVAKFLLKSAVGLEKMVISTKEKVNPNAPSYIFPCDGIESEKNRLLTDELRCALENLVTSPKASTKAVIYFA